MQDEAIERVILRIEELRGNPYYSEIKKFLQEIKYLLQSINDAIDDNVKKMPGAAKKIFKVTEATENATNEILDAVDSVLRKIDESSNIYNKMLKIIENGKMEVLDLVNTSIQFINENIDKNELIKYLTDFREKYENENLVFIEFNKMIEESRDILSNIMNDSTQIMMSSQVQDITSQQLAAVNHTLENIQKRLVNVLFVIESMEVRGEVPRDNNIIDNQENISKLHRDIAFDPEAVNSISNKDTKQDEIDELLKKHSEGTITEEDLVEAVSNDDIDALINGFTSFNESSSEEETGGAMSQDDINALFG